MMSIILYGEHLSVRLEEELRKGTLLCGANTLNYYLQQF